jgi:hypothetical protein
MMLGKMLHSVGLHSVHLHVASLASVLLCLALWIRAKTMDQDERSNAERRAIFVGLWPPTLWLIGNTIEQHETMPAARSRRWLSAPA